MHTHGCVLPNTDIPRRCEEGLRSYTRTGFFGNLGFGVVGGVTPVPSNGIVDLDLHAAITSDPSSQLFGMRQRLHCLHVIVLDDTGHPHILEAAPAQDVVWNIRVTAAGFATKLDSDDDARNCSDSDDSDHSTALPPQTPPRIIRQVQGSVARSITPTVCDLPGAQRCQALRHAVYTIPFSNRFYAPPRSAGRWMEGELNASRLCSLDMRIVLNKSTENLSVLVVAVGGVQ